MFDTPKTKTIGLLCGEKTVTISEAISIQYRNVMDGRTDERTDRQTDGQTDGQTDDDDDDDHDVNLL